jgi:hypothetical protein
MTAQAKPRSKRRKLPAGMPLRGRTYHADFMKDGRRIRKRLSTDLEAAKDMLNELRSRADRGELELLDNRYPWTNCARTSSRGPSKTSAAGVSTKATSTNLRSFPTSDACRW